MNDYIKSLGSVKLAEPIFSYRDLSEEHDTATVEYAVQWALEHAPARQFVVQNQELSNPLAFLTKATNESHSDRVKEFLLPSLVSKVSLLTTDEGVVPYKFHPSIIATLHRAIDNFFKMSMEDLAKIADMEVAKTNPIVYLCFWFSINGFKDVPLEEFFDVEEQVIIGKCLTSAYVRIAVAAKNENCFRFISQEELDKVILS